MDALFCTLYIYFLPLLFEILYTFSTVFMKNVKRVGLETVMLKVSSNVGPESMGWLDLPHAKS